MVAVKIPLYASELFHCRSGYVRPHSHWWTESHTSLLPVETSCFQPVKSDRVGAPNSTASVDLKQVEMGQHLLGDHPCRNEDPFIPFHTDDISVIYYTTYAVQKGTMRLTLAQNMSVCQRGVIFCTPAA